MSQKYRLVTRSDFDGLVCTVLFKKLDMVDDVLFVHPKDVQDGKIEITKKDILANLPYNPAAHLVFDHHMSETLRTQGVQDNYILDPNALSTARLVYNHFEHQGVFQDIPEDMMLAVDKADSAHFSVDDILNPSDWVLLNFIMDPRTGLGRFCDFAQSNHAFMMRLVDACTTLPIKEILSLPDMKERLSIYTKHMPKAKEQVERCGTVYKHLVVLDLRNEETIWSCNRFLIYALFTDSNISMHVLWGRQQQNTVFAVGKSIFDRSNSINIGALMLAYRGGGHMAAGTCQVENDVADTTMQELISTLSA